MDLRFYFSLFLRRLHWFILTIVVCSVVAVWIAGVLPTVYRAEARLLVESEQIPDALAASTVLTQATEQLQIIQQRILTRDILIELSNRLGIYADRADRGQPPLAAEDIVTDLRDRLMIEITGNTGDPRRGNVQATIVTVSFKAPTAAMAASVTNAFVTLILQENVTMRTGVARQTLVFFEQEVERLDRELATRGATILDFKQNNLTSLPDSLEFRRSQQAAAQERLLQFERADAELRDRRARMVRLNEASLGPDGMLAAQASTPDQAQLLALRGERSRQLAVLSPENPRIKVLDAQVAALEKIVAQELTGSDVGMDGQLMTAFDIQLADLDGQMTYVADQKIQIQAQIDALTESINATPGNEISLDVLQRDYDAVQAQYEQAVSARAKAATGDTIEALSKGQRISVIEQAIAPLAPTSPNRPLIAFGGLGGGFALGLAVVALLALLTPGIRRPGDLTTGLGITPFATLPYMFTSAEISRRRMLVWGAVLAAVLALAALLWLVHIYYVPLDLLIEQTLRRFR
jgi:uncharacterized protein involved in exopolysaccharide biosynthesis